MPEDPSEVVHRQLGVALRQDIETWVRPGAGRVDQGHAVGSPQGEPVSDQVALRVQDEDASAGVPAW